MSYNTQSARYGISFYHANLTFFSFYAKYVNNIYLLIELKSFKNPKILAAKRD